MRPTPSGPSPSLSDCPIWASLAICAAVGVEPGLKSMSFNAVGVDGDHVGQRLEVVLQLVRSLLRELLEGSGRVAEVRVAPPAELAIAAPYSGRGLREILALARQAGDPPPVSVDVVSVDVISVDVASVDAVVSS